MYKWFRPAPSIKEPGKYDSIRSKSTWIEKRIADWDKEIASYIIQDDINSEYAGSAIRRENGVIIVEGVKGTGEDFMLGKKEIEPLPELVVDTIRLTLEELLNRLIVSGISNKSFSIEWGIENDNVIIFQFNFIEDNSNGDWVVEPTDNNITYINYDATDGLEGFRNLILNIKDGEGINLIGNIGITSHFGDLLRKHHIPSRIINRRGLK